MTKESTVYIEPIINTEKSAVEMVNRFAQQLVLEVNSYVIQKEMFSKRPAYFSPGGNYSMYNPQGGIYNVGPVMQKVAIELSNNAEFIKIVQNTIEQTMKDLESKSN